MAASGVAQLAAAALIFATLVLGQGEQMRLECDFDRISACYSDIGRQYGLTPLTNAYDKSSYLESLCQTGPSAELFPAEPTCKESYASCSNEEKKKFATMERGYAALREATSDSLQCQSVASLRDCIDLDVITKCEVDPQNKMQTMEGQLEANKEGVENLKRCLKDAAKGCTGKQHVQAIAQLDKITSAMADLNTLSDGRNSASSTNAAMAVVVAVSLTCLARGFY